MFEFKLKIYPHNHAVVLYCTPMHHLQVMEFYCESCETAMCLECTEGEHREHVTVPLRDVLEQHKSVLKNQLDTVRNRYDKVCYCIQKLENANSEVSFYVNSIFFLLADSLS